MNRKQKSPLWAQGGLYRIEQSFLKFPKFHKKLPKFHKKLPKFHNERQFKCLKKEIINVNEH